MAGAVVAAAWAFALPAAAQVTGSLSATSDYRVRGLSLSNRRPAFALSLADDLANGVYLGGSALTQADGREGLKALGDIEYLGFARRLAGGAVWDAGLTHQHYRPYAGTPVRLSYSEVYVGLSKDALSTRLSYSPNYNGHDHNVAYLEANAAARPTDDWRLTAHVGVLKALNRWRGFSLRPHYDARVDAVRRMGRFELDLGWAAASPEFPPQSKRGRGGLVAGVTAFF